MDIETVQTLKLYGVKGMAQLEILSAIAGPSTLEKVAERTGIHSGRIWSAIRSMPLLVQEIREGRAMATIPSTCQYVQTPLAATLLEGIQLEFVQQLRHVGVQGFAQLSILAVADIPRSKRDIATLSGLKESTISQTVYTMQGLLKEELPTGPKPGRGSGRPKKLFVRTRKVSQLIDHVRFEPNISSEKLN